MVTEFNRQVFPPAVAALIPNDAETELGVGRPDESLRAALAGFDLATALLGKSRTRRGGPAVAPDSRHVVDRSMAAVCHAGLWLLHGFLDESHALSQQIETPCGSFWHAIMHRREGDYSNAGYWFRRVGRHPIYPPLAEAAATVARECGTQCDPAAAWLVGQTTWDPIRFVDLVEQVVAGRAENVASLCRRIARREWELLFEHCYRSAIGEPRPGATA